MGKKEVRKTCLRRVFPVPNGKGGAVPTACLKKCIPILYKSSDKAGKGGLEVETTCLAGLYSLRRVAQLV